MRIALVAVAVLAAITLDVEAQRRSGGTATLAILVTDPAGTPIGNVRVIVQGPAARQSRTERGRIVFEDIPPGSYRLRFERDGYLTLERELTARGGAPVDVKITLTPVPKPLPRIDPLPPPPPPDVKAEAVTIDMSAFIEKNYIGRSPGKTSPLSCAAGATATLVQVREPLAEHTHADADEFLYVIAGAGAARIAGTEQALKAGAFVMVPRQISHELTAAGRSPMVLLSIRAGEPCAPPPAAR